MMKKAERIKKSTEIEAVLKEKKSIASQCFVVYKMENHEYAMTRFAISVPKKFGIAVKRNQMKRRIRAIVASLPFKKGFDVFVVVKAKAASLGFSQIRSELQTLFQKDQLLEVITSD